MKKVLINIFKVFLNFIYLFIKLFPTKRRVTMLSRQSSTAPLDFKMLAEEIRLQDESIDVVILAKTLTGNFLSYAFHIIKQMRYIATSKVVVVDSYCIPVSILKHKEGLTVLQIWHALSAIKKFGRQTVEKKSGADKVTAEAMNMHKNYDFIACSGDVTAGHFCEAFGYPAEKIVKLGLPRIDYILHPKENIAEEIKEHYPEIGNAKKNILYVPTFRKGKGVPLDALIKNISFEKYNLIIKLHPKDAKLYRETDIPGVVFINRYNVYDLLNIADIIISDYSSFVVEASLLEKPVFLYTYDFVEYVSETGLNIDLSRESIGRYRFEEAGELANAIEKEYDYSLLKTFQNKYIDIDVENCTKKMASFLIDKINNFSKGENT